MSNFVKINNKINKFNKNLSIDGDKSLSIRWALLSSQSPYKNVNHQIYYFQKMLLTL